MSDNALAHLAFLGEREERFLLTPEMIVELEQVLDAGIGTIFKRLGAGHYRHAEITQTIRLGLIGAGMKPEVAARLTSTYVADRPIVETLPIALSILELVFYGAPLVQAVLAQVAKGATDAA